MIALTIPGCYEENITVITQYCQSDIGQAPTLVIVVVKTLGHLLISFITISTGNQWVHLSFSGLVK